MSVSIPVTRAAAAEFPKAENNSALLEKIKIKEHVCMVSKITDGME